MLANLWAVGWHTCGPLCEHTIGYIQMVYVTKGLPAQISAILTFVLSAYIQSLNLKFVVLLLFFINHISFTWGQISTFYL